MPAIFYPTEYARRKRRNAALMAVATTANVASAMILQSDWAAAFAIAAAVCAVDLVREARDGVREQEFLRRIVVEDLGAILRIPL